MSGKLVLFPDPILKTVSVGLERSPNDEGLNEARVVMRQRNGVGISAIQIGVPERWFILDVGEGVELYVNPSFVSSDVLADKPEGCLSFPRIFESISRYKTIEATWDEWGPDGVKTQKTASFDGLRAQAFQHELDHLNGIVLIDRVKKGRKDAVRSNILLAKRKGLWW